MTIQRSERVLNSVRLRKERMEELKLSVKTKGRASGREESLNTSSDQLLD